jgi:hypothetical protein
MKKTISQRNLKKSLTAYLFEQPRVLVEKQGEVAVFNLYRPPRHRLHVKRVLALLVAAGRTPQAKHLSWLAGGRVNLALGDLG